MSDAGNGNPNLTVDVTELPGLARAAQQKGDLPLAAQYLAAYLSYRPNDVQARAGYVSLCLQLGLFGEALAALEAGPRKESQWQLWQGYCNQMLWNAEAASALFESLGQRDPAYLDAGLLTFATRPGTTHQALRARTAATVATRAPKGPKVARFKVAPGEDRVLRIGYVSAHFHENVQADFIEPILMGHDRSRFQIVLFPTQPVEDARTQRMKSLADGWVPLAGLPDDKAVDLVRGQRLDLLVDLTGHLTGHRLGVFALRAAPLQVASLLGYPYTTGLPHMDAALVDAVTDPAGAEDGFSEDLFRVEGPLRGWMPPRMSPAVGQGPVNRPFTFGCLVDPGSLSHEALRTMASVLKAMPEALLALTAMPRDSEGMRRRVATLEHVGIEASRVRFHPPVAQLDRLHYHQNIDVMLDASPWWDPAATLEALWMGVPVLHLDRPERLRHQGRRLLVDLGLEDWVVADDDAFVAQAVARAQDLEGLATLRTSLRDRMMDHPMLHPRAVAQTYEAAYLALWRRRLQEDGSTPA